MRSISTLFLFCLAWTVAATDLAPVARFLQDDSNSTEVDDGPDLDLTAPRINSTDDGEDDPFHSLPDDTPAYEPGADTGTNGGGAEVDNSGAGAVLPALAGVVGILSIMM